jgi:CRP/FNR family transcriptional regulator, cyclic AMP receptor protein
MLLDERGQAATRSPVVEATWGEATDAAPAVERQRRGIRVFERLPELLEGLSPEAATAARRHGVAAAAVLDPGRWRPAGDPDRYAGWLGLLITDGLAMRSVAFDDMRAEELLGPGDVIRPWENEGAAASLQWEAEWNILSPTTVAMLDARFAAVVCHWPSVVAHLVASTVARSHSRSVHLAIAQARRAEVRLLLLFWHLADRFGRVGSDGVVVPVPLTHERLAGLVCLRRPTVSVALQHLRRTEHVVRRPDGSWLLPQEPPELERLLAGEDLVPAAA